MISHFSFRLYHLGNGGCMGSDGVKEIILYKLNLYLAHHLPNLIFEILIIFN
jgi:hypothetical protein